MKVFVHDVQHCNGCYNCQIACKDEHCGNDWAPIARPQPDMGQFWLRLHEHIRGTVPKVKMHYVPKLCNHCDNAACRQVCPVEGAIYKRSDGLVVIDPARCTGCGDCVSACPYGAIYFNQELSIVQKCTGCAHLLDKGWDVPRCVDACPTEALKFLEETETADLLKEAETLLPEQGTQPRVFYLNVPKKFISGTVYDPEEEEIIEHALCTLAGDGRTWRATTDGFGDFWFEGLSESTYVLTIEAHRFPRKTIEGISTDTDVNLGDIALAQ